MFFANYFHHPQFLPKSTIVQAQILCKAPEAAPIRQNSNRQVWEVRLPALALDIRSLEG